MEAAGIQLSSLCPTNYLNVPSLKMSVIWALESTALAPWRTQPNPAFFGRA